MKFLRDIQSPWLIHAKAALFVVVGALSAGLLLVELPTLKAATLLVVTVWACCRFYYYLFYVLDRYLGREKRFASIADAVCYLLTCLRRNPSRLPACSSSPISTKC